MYKYHDRAKEQGGNSFEGKGMKKSWTQINDYITSRSQLESAAMMLDLKDALKMTGDFEKLKEALVNLLLSILAPLAFKVES